MNIISFCLFDLLAILSMLYGFRTLIWHYYYDPAIRVALRLSVDELTDQPPYNRLFVALNRELPSPITWVKVWVHYATLITPFSVFVLVIAHVVGLTDHAIFDVVLFFNHCISLYVLIRLFILRRKFNDKRQDVSGLLTTPSRVPSFIRDHCFTDPSIH